MAQVFSRQPDREVTLIVTGCHTNVALLITLFPEIKSKISRIVMLGGAMGLGNVSPAAEFNILIDPEASKIVFESGIDIVMVPLEVSHTALVTPSVTARIEEFRSPLSLLLVDLLTYFGESYKREFQFDYPPLHDPLAVAYVIAPEIFQTKHMRVDIETASPICSGRTVCDVFNQSKLPKNAHVAQTADISKFWDLLISALRSADAISPLNKM